MEPTPDAALGRDADERLGSAIAGILAFGACLLASAVMLRLRTTVGPWIPFAVFLTIVLVFGRSAGVLMGPYIGLVAAFFFDFFFTRPYGSIHIDSESQLVACLSLIGLGVGLGLGRWVARAVRHRASPSEASWPTSP
jgi:K+-sensing histidine kinase KdpD